jgi:hypothetical protein
VAMALAAPAVVLLTNGCAGGHDFTNDGPDDRPDPRTPQHEDQHGNDG